MVRIFVDIETLPPEEDCRRQLSPITVRKLLKRSRQDGCDDSECTEEEFRALALHGEFGRVLTIGIIVEQDGQITERGVLGRERQTMTFHLDEARTLRGFWRLLKSFSVRRDIIVGHNIYGFDLPFLIKRSLIHRIKPTVQFPFYRYKNEPIYDTMMAWTNWGYGQFISLHVLAEVLKVGVAKSDRMDGSCIYDRFCEGCHQEIAEYCLQDCEVVRAVYYAMEFPEGPEPPPLTEKARAGASAKNTPTPVLSLARQ